MLNYPVSQKKIEALRKKIAALGLRESDFEETFTRSQGCGGQNVNKVSSRVALRHLPTGLGVECQQERSQALNRFLAMRLVLEKIEAFRNGINRRQTTAQEKIRRQKRRRSRRAKDRMLRDKKEHSAKKELRGKVTNF